MKNLPLISIVIPTFNEEKSVGKCLNSIFRQSYPKSKIEVIVVDDSSTDKTLKIVKKFPVKIFKHNNRHGEVGKMIGFRKATGKYAIYLDADIELIGKNWFQKMIKPMEENIDVVGSFTRYYARRKDSPLERYYALDPLQRDTIYQVFSPSINKSIENKRKGYYLLSYKLGNIPPAGLVMYRRKKLLNNVSNYDMFLELDFLVLLTQNGFNKFAYVPSAGLYHHHASDLKVLIRKRRYNVSKVYLKTYSKKLYKWFDLKNPVDVIKIFLLVFYANAFIPGVIMGLYKSIKHNDWAGMYEPVVSLVVTDAILYEFLISFLRVGELRSKT